MNGGISVLYVRERRSIHRSRWLALVFRVVGTHALTPVPLPYPNETSQQGILRIIYAFYMGLTRAQAPYVSIPLNCIVKLEPSAFHCQEEVCRCGCVAWRGVM